MKNKNVIFYGLKKIAICSLVVLSIFSLPAYSAEPANGCDEDMNNDRINPQIALCSAHAYNIGAEKNPTDKSDKELMNQVVAMKTTVITQQMKKQYDFLETTVKRLKTQLEKSVLTSNLEAAGATSSSDGSTKSTDKNVILAGTDNCNNKSTSSEVYTCLRQNYNVLYNMSNGGQTLSGDNKKQLAKDYYVSVSNLSDPAISSFTKDSNEDKACKNATSISTKELFGKCLDALNTNIRKASDAIERNNKSKKD